jgi:hypothetical protein
VDEHLPKAPLPRPVLQAALSDVQKRCRKVRML